MFIIIVGVFTKTDFANNSGPYGIMFFIGAAFLLFGAYDFLLSALTGLWSGIASNGSRAISWIYFSIKRLPLFSF